jgi:hypothetical protein
MRGAFSDNDGLSLPILALAPGRREPISKHLAKKSDRPCSVDALNQIWLN